MNVERLVMMANDIAAFFGGESDHQSAAASVAQHLTRFWDPRMRRDIIEHHRTGGRGLSPLATEAVAQLAGGDSARVR